jgi:hypothetical protein
LIVELGIIGLGLADMHRVDSLAPPRGLSVGKQLKLKQREFYEYFVHHGNAARAALWKPRLKSK